MKYTYAYKTSDGSRHEASIEAASRDEAFALLRKEGIRPIKVVAADGAKANGEIRGVRKRVVAAIVALVAVAVGVFAYFQGTRSGVAVSRGDEVSAPRHQIYGDPAIMQEFERGEFGAALEREGDRLLARFAQPGKVMGAKTLGEGEAAAFAAYADGELAVARDVAIEGGDSREVRELKQIVNGMREEMRAYLANGNGTPRSYWRRLVERTAQEAQIYDRTRRELEGEASAEVWEQKNDALRRLGLRTIPNPNE